MLDALHVKNLALISDVTLEPAPGLTVLTGETGAGKSALLSAVKLLLGERASGESVRDGADALTVEGIFYKKDAPEEEQAAFPDGHIATRRVSSEGRSRCSIDGGLATVTQLAETLGPLVDLCGQHDHQRLLNPASHRALYDAWLGSRIAPAQALYEEAFHAHSAAQAQLDQIRTLRTSEAGKIEDARFALDRIDEVDPKEGEYEELEAALPRLQHAEALAQAAHQAYELLFDDNGALDSINSALAALNQVASYDSTLEGYATTLQEALYPIEDVASELRRYRDNVDFDPQALQRSESRMGELIGIMKAFGPRMEDVLARRAQAQDLLAMVDNSQEAEARAQQALDVAGKTLQARADELGAIRQEHAGRFAREVSAQMDRLHMGGALLTVDIARRSRSQWTAAAADTVTFAYQPGPGLSARAFNKIASGGEISRVMLAIKVVLGAHDDVDTLIFDEIDAGVGGETARCVADVLADLARTHQVIVVSHLAQIAVCARCHYVVSKASAAPGAAPETLLEQVQGEQRVEEIARMLSGDTSGTALDHARRMLQERAF